MGLVRPVFTAPSYELFTQLMAGWVLTPGRHTITRMLTLADPASTAAHDAYHRLVRVGRWSPRGLWQALAVHAINAFCPDGVLELLVDDTLVHKTGQKVNGAGTFRDAVRSTVKRIVYGWGLNVVVICLRIDPPWGGTPIAVPINLRVRHKPTPGQPSGPTTIELAAEMIREIADWLPDRNFHLTGDGAYATLAGHRLPRTHVTARLRRDAALFELPPPRPARPGRGRPPGKGPRLPKPAELATAAAPQDWQQVTVDCRGRTLDRQVHVRDVIWHPNGKQTPVRLVVVRDPSGVEPDDFFITTNPCATGAQTASRYYGRWPIEVTFKSAKQHTAVQDPQTWKGDGPTRAVVLGFWVHSAVWCHYLTQWADQPTWPERPWYTRKTRPSFHDALAHLRRALWTERITALSPPATLNHRILTQLVDTLAEAA